MVDEGSTIEIWVSTGPDTVEVPSITGYNEYDAKAALDEAGLSYNFTSEYSDSVSKGLVAVSYTHLLSMGLITPPSTW